MVQKESKWGKKVSSIGRHSARTEADPLESSRRNLGDSQESDRKMVNGYDKDSININVIEAENKKFAIPTPILELKYRSNESRTVGLGGRSDISNTTRRLSLPSRKIN
jgi:hypothetical protein